MLLGATPARAAGGSELSDEPLPLQVDKVPARPQPLELGTPFLGPGPIGPGFEIPGGAVWQPQLLVWGTLRSAVQSFDRLGERDTRSAEWRSRLDIFAELEVSPTERVVVGFRPFDDDGRFSGCEWEPAEDDCQDELNPTPEILFVEANLGELFVVHQKASPHGPSAWPWP